jgi:hypothetical protein
MRAIFFKTSHNAIMNFIQNFMFTMYNTFIKRNNNIKIIYCVTIFFSLENTLVVEIQKGILLYSCHIVRKFLNIDTEHKTQESQNVETLVIMLISTALLLDSIIRNSICTPAKLPCRRVAER